MMNFLGYKLANKSLEKKILKKKPKKKFNEVKHEKEALILKLT